MRRLILPAVAILLLNGCGGGGGGDTTDALIRPSDPAPQPLQPDATWSPRLTGATPIELHRIDSLRAQANVDGSGVRIGVVGTGANEHAELTGRISPDSFGIYQGQMKDGIAYTGTGSDPVILDETAYQDISGHGHDTGVSSIAAGSTTGAAPGATLVEAKVFWEVTDSNGDTFEQTSDIIVATAINELASRNVQVVNASIGWGTGPADSLTLLNDSYGLVGDALNTLLRNDTALVLSAGNEGAREGINAYIAIANGAKSLYLDPALNKVLVAYSYSSLDEDISSWSNRPGTQAECATIAPADEQTCRKVVAAAQNTYIGVLGEDIEMADAADPGGFVIGTGTSFAAPTVSGTFALIKQGWPWLKAEQIVQILKDSADKTIYDKYFAGWQNDPELLDQAMGRFGVGLLDAEAALGPLGSLTTGSATTTAYSPDSFRLAIPSTSSALTTALARTQAFDSFGRNFTVDLSDRVARPAAQGDLTPSFHRQRISARLRDATLSLTRNGEQIDSLRLTQGRWWAALGRNSALLEDTLHALSGVGELRFEHFAEAGLRMGERAHITLFSGQYRLMGRAGERMGLNTRFDLGRVKLSLGLENGRQREGLPNLVGDGPASLGEGDFMLMHTALRWRSDSGGQLTLSLRYGPARSLTPESGFFTLEDVQMGQTSLTWLSPSDRGARWGVKVWSPLQPVAGRLNWRIPTDVNPATGEPIYTTGSERLGRGLLPDSVTLFYQKRW